MTIHDKDDIPCVSAASQLQRWQHHFTKVLNIVSQYEYDACGVA